eukprot:g6820.t1
MTPTEGRGLTAVLVLLLSSLHASAWVTPGLVREGSFSSQVSAPAPTGTRTPSAARRRRQVLTCKLDRLPARTLKRVVPLRPTTERYLAFFGQTPFDRRRKMINMLGGMFAFYWAAFFATRNVYVLGPGGVNAIAWRGSCLAVFLQTFLRPMLGSYNRALELWGTGSKEARRKTKGALFTGRVTRTGFALSPQASKHRTHFQMLVEDESGRELLFDVPPVPEYRHVRRGMQCAVVVLSRSAGFYELTGVTEAYLPELDLFVGRFPLLDKRVFWSLLEERKGRERRGRSGAVTTRHKAGSLSSSAGTRARLLRSRGAGEDRTGVESDGDGYKRGKNSSYRARPQQQQRQLQQRNVSRDMTPGGSSKGSR